MMFYYMLIIQICSTYLRGQFVTGSVLVSLAVCVTTQCVAVFVGVEEVVRRGRLRWFGHVKRKEADDWVSKCSNLEVVGGARKGRCRKTWMECVKEDMKECGLKKEEAQNRPLWSTKVNCW